MTPIAKLRPIAEAMLTPHAGAVDDKFFETFNHVLILELLDRCEERDALLTERDEVLKELELLRGRRRPVVHADGLFPGVDHQVVADFKSMRTKQRASITVTVMTGIQREADKARMTLEQALIVCCERNWRSFRAEWVIGESPAEKAMKKDWA